jgi:hypothetical protein
MDFGMVRGMSGVVEKCVVLSVVFLPSSEREPFIGAGGGGWRQIGEFDCGDAVLVDAVHEI